MKPHARLLLGNLTVGDRVGCEQRMRDCLGKYLPSANGTTLFHKICMYL